MKVIGTGFGRTGTTSIKAALEVLGFPCYHMSDVLAEPERARLWLVANDHQAVDWRQIFRGYQATVGWPGVAFWRELVDEYPTAKVLHSVRDPNNWYDSMDRTVFHAARRSRASGFRSPAKLGIPPSDVLRMIDEVLQRSFHSPVDAREHAIEVFERHDQEVKEYVDADRLLVYEVARGWEPLCAFLGVPVPAVTPFPYLNDTTRFPYRLRALTFDTTGGLRRSEQH